MGDEQYRVIPVRNGTVQCLPDKEEPVDYCRLCIHAREFFVQGRFVASPSLAYCLKCNVTDEVDLKRVEFVKCADRQGEGFHSIASIIG
jgi:hypothetical protein